MCGKSPMRRKPVSWKTKLGAAFFSTILSAASAIFLTHSRSDDEIWMVSGFIVFLAMIAAMSSDVSWKMKFGAVFAAGLLVGMSAILITQVYPVNAIWLMPAVIVCMTGFYAGFASGIVRDGQDADMEMAFDGQRNARWMTDADKSVAFPKSPEAPHPIFADVCHGYVDVPFSRGAYDYARGFISDENDDLRSN